MNFVLFSLCLYLRETEKRKRKKRKNHRNHKDTVRNAIVENASSIESQIVKLKGLVDLSVR